MTPKARSMRLMREQGYHVVDVELRQQVLAGRRVQVTKDMGGFADLLCWCTSEHQLPHSGCVAVQVTTRKQLAAHRRKYRRDAEVIQRIEDWLEAGNQFVLHGWERKQVGKAVRWILIEEDWER